MMNKKNLLCFMMLFTFMVDFVYAEPTNSNFVSVLNGSNTQIENKMSSSVFIGQPLVFETKDTKDLVVSSGFASVILKSQSPNITFTNLTNRTFTKIDVPVKVKIETTVGKITKIRYQISQGGSGNWEPEHDDYSVTPAGTVEFSKIVSFNEGKSENYVRVYAQYEDGSGGYASSWSPAYTIEIEANTDIEFINPDPLTKLSSLDPTIQTNSFSLSSLPKIKVSLFKGNSDVSGINLYEIELDTETNKIYKMYDESLSKISYLNSEIIKIYNEQKGLSIPTTLENNKEYTLKIESFKGTKTVTFKAISGGVADILTYPSPFNPNKEKVKIRYLLAKDSGVTIKIYDKAGKIVSKLIQSEHRVAGTNEEEWNGKNYAGEKLATGAYIVEIIAKSSSGEDRRYTALAIVGK